MNGYGGEGWFGALALRLRFAPAPSPPYIKAFVLAFITPAAAAGAVVCLPLFSGS